jgi:hypothetical protein
MPVIPATQEVEVRESRSKTGSGKNQRPISKTPTAKRPGGMNQVIKCFISLSSDTSKRKNIH